MKKGKRTETIIKTINMNTVANWKDLAFNSFGEMMQSFVQALPNILGAILILVVGWLFTKLIIFLLRKLLQVSKIEKFSDIIKEKKLLGKVNFSFQITDVIIGFVKWFLYLIILVVASDAMNWDIVSTEVSKLLMYLPVLFSSLALFMIGLYIANFVKKVIQGLFDSLDLRGSKIISSLVFYIILIIVTVTSLNQAGIETELITNNLTLVLGAFLATFVIAFGLGSREIIADLLKTFYLRKTYEVGQKIKLNDISGEIESIENLSMTIKTERGKVVIPVKEVIANQVEID